MSFDPKSVRGFVLIAVLSFLCVYLTINAIGRRSNAPVTTEEALVTPGTVITRPDLRSLSGQIIHLKDQVQPALYVFFSIGCPACARSTEYWRALDQEAQQWNVPVRFIAVEDEAQGVKQFVNAYGVEDLAVWYDAFGQCDQYLSIKTVPQYMLVDRAGKVLQVWAGALSPGSDVTAAAKEVLEYVRFLLR